MRTNREQATARGMVLCLSFLAMLCFGCDSLSDPKAEAPLWQMRPTGPVSPSEPRDEDGLDEWLAQTHARIARLSRVGPG